FPPKLRSCRNFQTLRCRKFYLQLLSLHRNAKKEICATWDGKREGNNEIIMNYYGNLFTGNLNK
ncbi:MAG: hypothetical protein IJJ41_02225, partial [Clostridia bacterium]|nr:hypothetical protein [Clostridia bacterium]